MKIAVIGGGPSGFAAAIKAAAKNEDITIIEKNSKVLKKLAITGNGKCNYFNEVQDISKYHSSSKNLEVLINTTNIDKVKDFWDNLGIIPYIKNGYYYPFTNNSNSIITSLIAKAKNLGIKIIEDTIVEDIIKIDDKFLIKGNNYNEYFDKVIIATGSLAYPKCGGTTIGYDIAKKMDHKIIKVNPSLVQLISNMGIEKYWNGIRCQVKVTHIESDNILKEEYGEIQLTDYGISGICVFNISRDISIGLSNNKKEHVIINFIPWYSGLNFQEYLDKRSEKLKITNIINLCEAFINYKLLNAILIKLKIKQDTNWQDLSEKQKKVFCQNLLHFEVPIIATKGFDTAQVCSGGINLEELDLNTLESKHVPNLYFCGEVLDLDGDCGGYNITIAILTGIIAGESC